MPLTQILRGTTASVPTIRHDPNAYGDAPFNWYMQTPTLGQIYYNDPDKRGFDVAATAHFSCNVSVPSDAPLGTYSVTTYPTTNGGGGDYRETGGFEVVDHITTGSGSGSGSGLYDCERDWTLEADSTPSGEPQHPTGIHIGYKIEGSCEGDQFTFVIDYGDGATDNEAGLMHDYAPGTYTATVTATDQRGQSKTATVTFTISERQSGSNSGSGSGTSSGSGVPSGSGLGSGLPSGSGSGSPSGTPSGSGFASGSGSGSGVPSGSSSGSGSGSASGSGTSGGSSPSGSGSGNSGSGTNSGIPSGSSTSGSGTQSGISGGSLTSGRTSGRSGSGSSSGPIPCCPPQCQPVEATIEVTAKDSGHLYLDYTVNIRLNTPNRTHWQLELLGTNQRLPITWTQDGGTATFTAPYAHAPRELVLSHPTHARRFLKTVPASS